MSNSDNKIINTNANAYNPQQVIDLIVSNVIASKFSDVLKTDFDLSVGNITKLLLLMSTGEMKTLMTYIFTNLISQFRKFPQLVYFLAIKFIKIMNIFKKKKTIEKIEEPQITKKYLETIRINVDISFMTSFYKFIRKYNSCEFTEKILAVNYNNIKERIFCSRLSKIVILFDDYTIRIENDVDYEINSFNNEITKVMSIENTNDNTKKNITSFLDLLTPSQRDVVSKFKDELVNRHGSIGNIVKEIYESGGNVKPFENKLTLRTVAELIVEKYPNLDKDITFVEIVIVDKMLDTISTYGQEKLFNILKKSNRILFDPENIYKTTKECGSICFFSCPDFGSIRSQRNISHVDLATTFDNLLKTFNRLHYGTTNPPENVTNTQIFLDLHISSTNDNNALNLKNIMEEFITKVTEYTKKTTTKIKIFCLSFENEKITSEKENPEYETWNQKKQMIDKIEKVKSGEKDNIDLLFFLNTPAPSKTITSETIKQKIVVKQLNEIEKDIDTLYLREDDKRKLMSSLFQFRDKKDLIKSLGLPNKLNVLLYGEPGTGKSTTIQAIATYLQKDIYYVDLKNIKTNQELQMMFEYVNKNANGAIVVCEDIDAMTNIVLKRENKVNEFKVNDLVNNTNSKLSLEYLLNILQGTLTMDDSIFLVTTNHIDHLDPAFYRDGRFDLKIELKLCDKYQINQIYNKMIGREIEREVIKKIPENKFSPATIIFHIKNYIFNVDMKDEEILRPFILDDAKMKNLIY
jgi:hypothetical protein